MGEPRVSHRSMEDRYLLISDLDDTLLGDDAALMRFSRYYETTKTWLGLVYASGRLFDSVVERIETTILPAPVAVIGGVGTEIRGFPGGEPFRAWWEKIGADWDRDRVRDVLEREEGLVLQPEAVQTAYKLSYFVEDAAPERLVDLERKIEAAGVAVECIYSSGCDLDFLPRGVNKGSAAAFLAEHLGYDADHVMVAGNSGNDLALFEQGFLGIIVGNAHEELKMLADRPRSFVAEQKIADGVREGIEFWTKRGAAHDVRAASDGSRGSKSSIFEEGYSRSIELLRECSTQDGFLATPSTRDNYRRIWGRDGSIIALAALMLDDVDLVETARSTLVTLAKHQGEHGEIPSNVDPQTRRVSYGGTAGRVDADLWFLIAAAEYWKKTEDDEFLKEVLEPVERTRFLLGAWEYNTRGLLYVPPTGDWADEYVHSGYVLYDQLLYLTALRGVESIHAGRHGSKDHALVEKCERLRHLIRANYWFQDEADESDAYHEYLFRKGKQAAPKRCGPYWMAFFSPLGYGYRFDTFANALVSLLGVSSAEQDEMVAEYVNGCLIHEDTLLLPAFHPVITPKDEDWPDLQMTFSHSFKNAPYEFHNGGRWSLVTAFYGMAHARRGKDDTARLYLQAVHEANRTEVDGSPWRFPEFLHGETLKPGGTLRMGWNAAAAILLEHCLRGERLFE